MTSNKRCLQKKKKKVISAWTIKYYTEVWARTSNILNKLIKVLDCSYRQATGYSNEKDMLLSHTSLFMKKKGWNMFVQVMWYILQYHFFVQCFGLYYKWKLILAQILVFTLSSVKAPSKGSSSGASCEVSRALETNKQTHTHTYTQYTKIQFSCTIQGHNWVACDYSLVTTSNDVWIDLLLVMRCQPPIKGCLRPNQWERINRQFTRNSSEILRHPK